MTTTANGSATSGPASSAGRLDAVKAGHADVEQAHVGAQAPRQLDGRPAVGRLAHDLDPGLGIEDHREPGPHQLLVVGDEDPDAHGPLPRGAAPRRPSSPRSGPGPASQVPPSMRARSAMPTSPNPVRPGPLDRFPVVADVQAYRVSSAVTSTAIRVARRACRRALVMDSCARR